MSTNQIVQKISILLFLVSLTTAAQAAAVTYNVDPTHANIGFNIKHLMVSDVRGAFNDPQGTISLDADDPTSLQAEVTIQAKNVDTNNADRDKHLSGPDFFDVEKYPTITFKSTSVKKEGNKYLVTGDLTLHGVTKSISIPMMISGPVKSPFGSNAIGLTGQTTINRQDFGMKWNKEMDQGGYVVGDDVHLDISVEAHNK